MSKPGAADGVNDDGTHPFDLEEFPAFPDLTIPFLGGIVQVKCNGQLSRLKAGHKIFLTPLFMADADIYSLEFLSLVAKITQEIDNHIGLNDKTAAEYLISLHDGSNQSLVAFKAKVNEIGLAFPDSFIENVDRLILNMHPKYKMHHAKSRNGKAKAVDTELSELDRKRRLFPGLAVKDKDVPPVSDDAFLQELGDLVSGRKTRPHPTDEPAPKRQRRSASPPRRRSPSPRGRNDGWGNRNGGGRPMDNKPILFKIYGGKVTGLKDFGAFVTLEGVSGRVEGTLTILIMSFSDFDSFDRHGSCL